MLQSPRSTAEFEHSVPDKITISSSISVQDTLRRENSGLVYEGYIKIPADGVYVFYLSSDDGSQLRIDNEIVIDNDGLHGNDETTGKTALKKGLHRFRLSYFQAKGDADLQLGMSLETGKKQPIPASAFYH
jgi:hypothetical protein